MGFGVTLPPVATEPIPVESTPPISPAVEPDVQPGKYHDAPRIDLGVSADYRGAKLSHDTLSPITALGLLALAVSLFFVAASWFIDFTQGEMRAMATVVDRLALPADACESCEKPFRIVELRARPYYDAPSEQMNLFDSARAESSAHWVEQMRHEVEEAKAWAEEQRQWQQEEEERLRDLAD